MSPALACGFFTTEPPGKPPGVLGSQNTLVPSSTLTECSAQGEVLGNVKKSHANLSCFIFKLL